MRCIRNQIHFDDPIFRDDEFDHHARMTSRREYEAGVAVHQSELRVLQAGSEKIRNRVSTANLRHECWHNPTRRSQACFHRGRVCSQHNVGVKDGEQRGEVTTARCSEKRRNDFALSRPVCFRLSRRDLNSSAPTTRELSSSRRRAANYRCNLIERDIKHVMQHECDSLGRRQGLEHNQHRSTNGVGDQPLVLQIVRCGESFNFGVDRDFASRLSFAEYVEADAGNNCCQPGGKIVNVTRAGTHEPKKRLLHRIVGLGS
ncbi:MAG TPA: hypothetical protein VET48_03890 [Steroidobacteraceae bacterium]|nr:hypothetical protein [Steroidobacteraceae bacterium]